MAIAVAMAMAMAMAVAMAVAVAVAAAIAVQVAVQVAVSSPLLSPHKSVSQSPNPYPLIDGALCVCLLRKRFVPRSLDLVWSSPRIKTTSIFPLPS